MCLEAILDIDPVEKTMTVGAGSVLPLSKLTVIVVRCPNAAVLRQLSEELDAREMPVWSRSFVFASYASSADPTADQEHCALLACSMEDAVEFGLLLLPLCDRLGAELDTPERAAAKAG